VGIGGEADDEFKLGAAPTASPAGEAALGAGAEASTFPEARAADVIDGGSVTAVLAAEAASSDTGETCSLAGAKSVRPACLTIAFPPIARQSNRTAPT
jgi:hypothetical protein